MRTTLLNPTIWLLAGTAAAALYGAWRGRSARQVAETVIRVACTWPILILLAALTLAGAGTRAVLGYLSPGAYVEEVLAAQAFAAERHLYPSHPREALSSWISASASSNVPWTGVPGITPCQANAIEHRAQYYTENAHPPTLLLAAVPVVRIAGGKGLYLLLVVLSLASVAVLASIVVSRTSTSSRSRAAVLAMLAIAAWQPVLAGIRQGDAALLAAALIAAAWHLPARRQASSALAVASAACLFPPSVLGILALLRVRARAAVLASVLVTIAVATAVIVAEPSVLTEFARTVRDSATTYADATANYAIAPQVVRHAGPVVSALALIAIIVSSWWIARTRDTAFAMFTAAALTAAPMLWSQHLALLFVPLVVLLEMVIRRGSPVALAAWAALALTFSLPDTAMIAISRMLSAMAGPLPIAPAGVLLLWGWLLASREATPSPQPAADAMVATS
jgi:hypothetical protein